MSDDHARPRGQGCCEIAITVVREEARVRQVLQQWDAVTAAEEIGRSPTSFGLRLTIAMQEVQARLELERRIGAIGPAVAKFGATSERMAIRGGPSFL